MGIRIVIFLFAWGLSLDGYAAATKGRKHERGKNFRFMSGEMWGLLGRCAYFLANASRVSESDVLAAIPGGHRAAHRVDFLDNANPDPTFEIPSQTFLVQPDGTASVVLTNTPGPAAVGVARNSEPILAAGQAESVSPNFQISASQPRHSGMFERAEMAVDQLSHAERVRAGVGALEFIFDAFYLGQGRLYKQFPTGIDLEFKNLFALYALAGKPGGYIPSDVSALITARENAYRTQVEEYKKLRFLGMQRLSDFIPISHQVVQKTLTDAQGATRINSGAPFLETVLQHYHTHIEQYQLVRDHEKALDNIQTNILVILGGLVRFGHLSPTNPAVKKLMDDLLACLFSAPTRPLSDESIATLQGLLGPFPNGVLIKPLSGVDATDLASQVRRHDEICPAYFKKAEEFAIARRGMRQVIAILTDLFLGDGDSAVEDYSLFRRKGFVTLENFTTLEELVRIHVMNTRRFFHPETDETYHIGSDPKNLMRSLSDDKRNELLAAQLVRRRSIDATFESYELYGLEREAEQLKALIQIEEVYDKMVEEAKNISSETVRLFEQRVPEVLRKSMVFQLWGVVKASAKRLLRMKQNTPEKVERHLEDLPGNYRVLSQVEGLKEKLLKLRLEWKPSEEPIELPPQIHQLFGAKLKPAVNTESREAAVAPVTDIFQSINWDELDGEDVLRLILTCLDQRAHQIRTGLKLLKMDAAKAGVEIDGEESLRARYQTLMIHHQRLLNDIFSVRVGLADALFPKKGDPDADKDKFLADMDAKQTLAVEIFSGIGYAHLIRFCFANADKTLQLSDVPLRLFIFYLEREVRKSEVRLPNIEPPPVASFFERDQNARLRTKKWSAWAWGTVTAALLVGGAVASYFQWDDVQAMKSWVSEWVNRRSHNEQILDTKGLPVGGTPLLPTEAGP